MKTHHRFFLFFALILSLFSFSTVFAQSRSLRIEDFHSWVNVQKSGVVEVREQIRCRFEGSWNGILRWIPYRYSYPNGVWGNIRLNVESVEDAEGRPLEYWESRKDGNLELKIRVPGAFDATRDVVLRYRAEDVLKSYGEHDELYWNVTGNGWVMPIRKAQVDVTLPSEIPGDSLQSMAYVGSYGARDRDWFESRKANTLHFETSRVLGNHEGFTVVVGFPLHYVEHPTMSTRLLWFAQANWPALIPLTLLAFFFFLWRRFGKDSLADQTVIPQFEAPMGLSPSEVGIVADDHLHQRDFTAAVVDLAVRRFLVIRERGEVEETDANFNLEAGPKFQDDPSLRPFERKLLQSLFPSGKGKTSLLALEGSFYTKAEEVKKAMWKDILSKGLFRSDPMKVIRSWLGFAILTVVLLFIFGVVLQFPLPFWVLLIPSAIGMFFLAFHMPKRTRKGLEVLGKIKGLEEYLRTAEKERMAKMPADHFEKLLPYAIALGLHTRWANAFVGLFKTSPDWYQSDMTTFSPLYLTHSLSSFSRSAQNSFFSMPRTEGSGGWSGGSGFSGSSGGGGGFSGGGFGGGGGRGW